MKRRSSSSTTGSTTSCTRPTAFADGITRWVMRPPPSLGALHQISWQPDLSRGEWLGRISGPGHHSIVESPGRPRALDRLPRPRRSGDRRRRSADRRRPHGSTRGRLTLCERSDVDAATPAFGRRGTGQLGAFCQTTASSVKDGRTAAALVDGEFAVDPAKERWEWAAAGEGKGAWIRLEWSKEQRARWVYLYPSVAGAAQGGVVDRSHQRRPGDRRRQAALGARTPRPSSRSGTTAALRGSRSPWTKWPEAAEAGMAEIIVLGYPGGLPGESRGSVWISSPRRGQIVHRSVLPCVSRRITWTRRASLSIWTGRRCLSRCRPARGSDVRMRPG